MVFAFNMADTNRDDIPPHTDVDTVTVNVVERIEYGATGCYDGDLYRRIIRVYDTQGHVFELRLIGTQTSLNFTCKGIEILDAQNNPSH